MGWQGTRYLISTGWTFLSSIQQKYETQTFCCTCQSRRTTTVTTRLTLHAAAEVSCVDLHRLRVCPRPSRPAVIYDLFSQCLARGQSAVAQVDTLLQAVMCQTPNTMPCFIASLKKSLDCCSNFAMSRSKISISCPRPSRRVHQSVTSTTTATLLRIRFPRQACSPTTVCARLLLQLLPWSFTRSPPLVRSASSPACRTAECSTFAATVSYRCW